VSDERGALDAKHAKEVAHPVGVRGDRVAGARLGRMAMPSRSGAITRWRSASAPITGIQVAELSPMPWMSTSGGPEPTSRNARQ
jgi:hypothetical protein